MLIVLLILLLFFVPATGYGYYNRAAWGPYPVGIGGFVVLLLIVLLIFGRI